MAETRYSLTTPAGFLVPAPTDTNCHGGHIPYGNTLNKIMNNITYSKFPSTPNRPTRPASTNAPNREVQKTHIINTSIVKELTF